jgi:hypothetical protein
MGEAKRRSEEITGNSKDPGRDEIVVVATIETIKRAWSDRGGIRAALAYIVTNDNDRFTVLSMGGAAMNTLLGLNPGDVARFTGRFAPPLDALPNIELSRVALIERDGRIEPWREEWFYVSRDQLAPDFRRRVANCRTQDCGCFSCGKAIETADEIVLIMLRDRNAGMVCADCGALPRSQLFDKLSVVDGVKASPARFVEHSVRAECAIAICCGLDPKVAVGWSVDAGWDCGLA